MSRPVLLVASSVAALFLAAQNPSFAQGKGGGGGGGGGHVETTGNNLSYPASFAGTVPTLRGLPGDFTLGGAFGQTWSYGCAKPETVGTTTYNNTSCVALGSSGTAQYLLPEQCTPCAGVPIERIYWQKQLANTWQAGTEVAAADARTVAFVNWGDNLETGQWTERSVIRVETTPFFDLGTNPALRGFEMWHVVGQGPSELWGLRATDADVPHAYVYDSRYTIIHTDTARLNLTKLGPLVGGASCPASGPPVSTSWTGNSWAGYCSVADLPYTPELNIGGKWVYGYNWQLRNQAVTGCLTDKSGWWRLTFYAPGDVLFDQVVPATEPPGQPTYSVAPTSAIPPLAETALYKATVDPLNNLTYIDVCIDPASARGGR